MTQDWLIRAETICMQCGGHCCEEAHPSVSGHGYQWLLSGGVPPQAFCGNNGYRSIRSCPDGHCVLWQNGKCSIHGIKPETCRAGPFTFDVKGDVIEIFLKFESVCPVVRLLKEVPDAYNQQYARAVKNISHLVSGLTEEELAVICRIEEPETK